MQLALQDAQIKTQRNLTKLGVDPAKFFGAQQ